MDDEPISFTNILPNARCGPDSFFNRYLFTIYYLLNFYTYYYINNVHYVYPFEGVFRKFLDIFEIISNRYVHKRMIFRQIITDNLQIFQYKCLDNLGFEHYQK